MEIEGIFLHGGAKGFSFINDSGTQKEYDSFFRRFYDKITKAAISIQKIESVSKSFIIESIPNSSKQFYDYTFMEHYVYDVSGRPSYFGITIRLSAFYCEVSDLYFILDTIFKKDIIGNFLLPKESTYMCTKEQIDKLLFEKVMNDIVQISSSVLQDSNLKTIRSVSSEKGSEISINLIDCHPKFVEKEISQYGRITISTDTPLQRESQSRQELDKLNQQWTAKWNDLQGKHTAAVNNAQDLNGTIQNLQGQLTQAQNNLQRVQREYDEYKSKNKLSYEVINGLKEEKQALLKLAGFIDTIGIVEQKKHGIQRVNKPNGYRENSRNRQEEDNDATRHVIKPYLLYIIPVIVLVLIALLLFSFKDCSGKGFFSFTDDKTAPISVVVEQPNNNHTTDAGRPEETVIQANNPSDVSEDVPSGDTNSKTVDVDIKKIAIDVAELTKTVTYMTKNSAYSLRILNKENKKTVEGIKGRWIINDLDFDIGNPNSPETAITPKRSGKDLEISFLVEGYEDPIKRVIEVKEK